MGSSLIVTIRSGLILSISNNGRASEANKNTKGIFTSSTPSSDIENALDVITDESVALSITIPPTAPASCNLRAYNYKKYKN